jgi:hypothetical protein
LMRRYAWLAIGAIQFLGLTDAAFADHRVALVIGNGAYVHIPHLPNPTNDAIDVSAALKRAGFETIVGADQTQAEMQEATIRFARAARNAEVALFYYSGHALQFGGINYLVPVDAQLHDEADLRRLVRVDEILADLQQAKTLRVLVLDSCRDNPLAEDLRRSIGVNRGVNVGRGLARIESPDGTIISYSTQAGRIAKDGDGRNSPYTKAFLKHIEEKEEIAAVFHHISANVYESTGGAQIPELSLSFFGEFYLNGKSVATAPSDSLSKADDAVPASKAIPIRPETGADAALAWAAVKDTTSQAILETFITRFSGSFYADLARARLLDLKPKSANLETTQEPEKKSTESRAKKNTRNVSRSFPCVRRCNGMGWGSVCDVCRRCLAGTERPSVCAM